MAQNENTFPKIHVVSVQIHTLHVGRSCLNSSLKNSIDRCCPPLA